jgi:Predicted RNA-binding protein homologous to eukaryotic snRNP
MADARVLLGENGEAEDVFPFPYLSRRTDAQRQYPTLSEAMDIYFGTRDARDRLNQRSAAMVRTLKGQLERCQRKLAIQTEELSSAERMDEYRRMGEALNANLYRLKKA